MSDNIRLRSTEPAAEERPSFKLVAGAEVEARLAWAVERGKEVEWARPRMFVND
jgi:hypothetical protein